MDKTGYVITGFLIALVASLITIPLWAPFFYHYQGQPATPSPEPTETTTSPPSSVGGLDLLNYIVQYPQSYIPDSEWWEMNTQIAIAKLYTNTDVDGANAWFSQVTDKHGADRYGVIAPEKYPIPYPYNVTASIDWEFVNVYIVRAYFQFKDSGKLSSQASSNLRNELAFRAGTIPSNWYFAENHNTMGHSAAYFGSVVTGGNRSGELAWLTNMLDTKLMYGFTELNSPTYMEAEWRVLWNLYDFAVDPVLKDKAKAVLDMLLAELASVHVQGMRPGPFYRYYGDKITNQTSDAHYGIAHCYFNTPLKQMRFYRIFPWFSSYRIPNIILKIAQEKAPFVMKSRRYMLNNIVSTYYYVTKSCALASVQGDFPDNQQTSTTTGHRSHNWDILFATSPYKLIFSGATEGAYLYSESDAVQKQNVLITSPTTQINYIGVKKISEDGWHFVHEGKTYVAIKTLPNERVLIEVRDADDYGKSFNEFKEQVKFNYLSVQSSSEAVTYRNTYGNTISSATRYTISGDSFSYKLFDCPYLQSNWGSGQITAIYESETYIINEE